MARAARDRHARQVTGHGSVWVPLTLSISAHQQSMIFSQTKVVTLRSEDGGLWRDALPSTSNDSYHSVRMHRRGKETLRSEKKQKANDSPSDPQVQGKSSSCDWAPGGGWDADEQTPNEPWPILSSFSRPWDLFLEKRYLSVLYIHVRSTTPSRPHNHQQEMRRVAGVENVLNPMLPVFLLGPPRQSIGSSL